MQNTFLFQLLRGLDRRDIRALQKLVRSPFFNLNEHVSSLLEKLLDTVEEHNPDESGKRHKKLEVERAKLTQTVGGRDKDLFYTMSALSEQVRTYIAQDGLQNDDFLKNILTIKGLRRRKIDQEFERQLKSAFAAHHKKTMRNATWHFQNYQLLLEEYDYQHRRSRNADLQLQEISDELNAFYIAEMLRQACAMRTHEAVTQKHYTQPLLDEALRQVASGLYQSTPSVQAYFLAYNILNDGSEHHFRTFKQFLADNSTAFPMSEVRDFYLLAINFCIRRSNAGAPEYVQEALDLYKEGLDTQVLLENKQLTPFTYNNILMLALKTQDYAWAKTFLETFKSALPAADRNAIFDYNSAMLHYRLGEFSEAMTLLRRATPRDPIQNLHTRIMLIRIYVETGEITALESLIESFTKFLLRQKQLGYHRDMCLNFLNFVQKLLKIKQNDEKQRAILRGEIEHEPLVSEKKWLLERLG
ncbi:MAG: hypothetical protein JNL70_21580 [Saprospiraceae bacterium]|nr:hypothetical protein [Saprospiraceae bacterium]